MSRSGLRCRARGEVLEDAYCALARTLRQFVVAKAIAAKELEELLCPVLKKSC